MRIRLGVILALVLANSSRAETVEVIVPAPVVVTPLETTSAVQPVSLARMAADMRPGTAWALEGGGLLCLPMNLLRWRQEDNTIGSDGGFSRIFREELGKVGFKVGGDPTNLFEEGGQASDLQIGALVKDLRMRMCTPYIGADGPASKGSAMMDVEWQIYSVAQGKVLARITTHGGYEIKKSVGGAAGQLIGGAFTDNARRLAANDEFRRIVTATPGPAASPAAKLAEIRMAMAPASKQIPLAIAAKGVVSIFAGGAMGSGVLISSEGYILTNHHVAGEAGRIRVRWPDGSDTVGEVIRADRRRDVALIKTTPKAEPLAIRHAPVQLGETVYAIGTPRERDFAGTLTRGVVSTTDRVLEGQSYIQSDVAITHGNSGGPLLDEKGWVVGLSDLVYEPNGVSQNINFFIPIDEALRVLALKPAS
jgi:S1-C subfamily serine protease